MRKVFLFIASVLVSVGTMAENLRTSELMKLSDATIRGISSSVTTKTPQLSEFEMPVLKSMKLSETDIPDGIENGQRTGIRKAPLAATVKISGLVDASTIADNSAIELVGNANLFMDANKTFKCITGNYALTVSGGNILTLSNAGGYAIDALSVTISCPLVVQTSYVAVSAKSGITINSSVNATSTNTCIGTVNGTITINADVTATTSSSAAILNRGLENGGDIVINKGTVTAIGGNTGIWAYGIAAMGHITAKEGTVIHASGGTGICAETGNIHLAGEVTANANGDGGSGVYTMAGEVSLSTISISSSGVGISAYNGLTLNGVTETNTADTGLGTVNGTLTINADVTATTAKSAAILSRGRDQGGDIIINSGTITATGGNTGIWAYGIAAGGNITAEEGTVIHASGGTGIYAEKGNIHLAGTVTSNANRDGGSGVYAKAGEVSLSTISISSSGVGISAYNGLTLNGVTETNTADTGLGIVNGTLTINADVTATTAKSAAILSRGRDQGGDIIINSGTITATGGNTGIWAYGIAAGGNITAEAGTVIHASGGTGIYAEKGNIHLAGTVTSNANRDGGSGVYAKAGEVSLSTITISSSGVGISAYNGLTLNGVTETNTADTGLGTVNGTLTINADVTATTAKSAAILSRGRDQGGDIIINSGTITATGGNTGIWAYGIAAGGNITAEAGTVIHASGGTGIFAEKGNIHLAGEAISIAKGKDGNGLYAKAGDISVSTIDITSAFVGISAFNGLTINGPLNATATNTCIGTVNGTLTINADVTATTSSSAAILCRGLDQGGDIIINKGTIRATGGNTAEWAYGIAAGRNINIKSGKVVAKGGLKGLFAEKGTITLKSPLFIASPWDGSISTDGHTVVDENKEIAGRVVIMDPPISGSVTLTSEPAPGDYVSFTLSGDVAMTIINNVWQISDDGTEWSDIEEEPAGAPARDGVRKAPKLATDGVYVPTEAQIGKYLRVKVEAEGRSGYLYSPVRRIAKFICTKVPEAPTLSISNNKVVVSNAKKTQEYILFNVQRDPAELVESDWAYAVSPDANGSLELDGVLNSLNCVYTRVKETKTTLAGKDVEWAPVYNGSQTALTAIKLSLENRTREFDIQGNELNCTLGDVIRITAAPVPSNATGWVGVKGSQWLVNGVYSGSPYGTYYADAACNTPLTASAYYSTVYFKTAQQKSCVELRAEITNAQGTIYRAQAINIGDANGEVLLDHVTVNPLTIGSGESLSGIRFYQYPKSATLENLTAETTGTYRVPILSFNTNTGKMSIDATNADQGEYTYTLKRNGEAIPDPFTVTVTKGRYDVDSIQMREKYITADPGEVVEIIPLLYPANSEADILWYTTDEVNGPVVNGKVTIAADAPIGTEIYITALAMGRYDNCKITVSGEKYGLYVASTQVTSRNRDDILGDGKFSFDGMRTLTMNGDVTLNTPVRLVQNTGVEDLLIDVVGNSTVTQEVGVSSVIFDLQKNTTIRGGLLSITANDVAISVKGNSTLTLDSANLYVYAQYPLSGNIVGNDSLSIINSRVEIRAKGSAAVDDFNGGISLRDCYIQTPEGGEIVDATIEDGNGTQVRNLLIVPNPEKTEPELAFASSEATATVGEAFAAPVLSNPNSLAINYHSENPMIAKVNAETGEVTLLAAGTTTITAYTNGDLFHEAGEVSYTLTVLKGTVSLAFSAPTASVKVDATEFVLPILSNPQDVEVTYSSSNPAVATLFALTGDMTLVAAGTTTITATFAGDEAYNGASASYILTVTSGDTTAIEDVRINSEKAQKILHEGMLYIIRPNGAIYNATGMRVK